MTIEYKTEGRVTLQGTRGAVALTWLKGDGNVTIHQGSNGKIVLDKAQLLGLLSVVHAICNDLEGPE